MSITKDTRRESYEKLDSATLHKLILEVFCKNNAALTAKEIAYELYKSGYVPYPVRQAVAPRITELVAAGKIIAVGKEYDAETGRNVAAYRLVVKA